MINNLISFIESLDVGQILFAFGVYLLFLWLLVPIWVYLDSKKKFKNDMLAVLLFLLVLPLNIPGLLFYIIIRPEDDIYEDIDDDHVVNIPIVNFVSDKNDLVLGFEIKLNGNIIKDDMAKDINLKVDLDHGKNVEFKQAVEAVKEEIEEDARGLTEFINKHINKVLNKFQKTEVVEEIVEEAEEKVAEKKERKEEKDEDVKEESEVKVEVGTEKKETEKEDSKKDQKEES